MAEAISADARLEVLGGLADALPDPLLLLDRRSLVLHRNPAAEREFPDLAQGALLTASMRNPALLGAIDAARRSGTAQTV